MQCCGSRLYESDLLTIDFAITLYAHVAFTKKKKNEHLEMEFMVELKKLC